MPGDGSTFGSEHVGPFPFVQPDAPTSPFAFDQPPAYQAQSIGGSCALSSSPIVGLESGGSLAPKAPNGRKVGCMVFTAKSPQARPATGDGHATVSAASLVGVTVGVYCGSARGIPFVSMSECSVSGAPGYVGVAAAISHWWLRNDPPNADWKKSSAIA